MKIDAIEENRRQAYLDWLYERDGRSSPAHPMHSLYTGLTIEREGELGAQELARVASVMGRAALEAEVKGFQCGPRGVAR